MTWQFIDMSSIENALDFVGQRLAYGAYPVTVADEHRVSIKAIWDALTQIQIKNELDSMLRRIEALIAACGGYIK